MRRVGLIGFGSIAENGHLPAWQSFSGVEVVAIADLSPERLERAREVLPTARLYESSFELIARAGVNAVDICTPPSTHANLIIAACGRGIRDIVSEKPFVLTEDEFRRVARARGASGCRIVSVNNWMHSDLNRLVLGELKDGAIGHVCDVVLRTGRTDSAQGNAGWMPRWRTDPAFSGGGIILDHGWHQLYLLLGWIGEPVVSVAATTRVVDPRHAPVEDEATVEFLFPSAMGRIELSWTAVDRSNDGLIRGDRGEIAIHDDRIVIDNDSGVRTVPFNSRLTESSYHSDWFEKMFRYNVFDYGRDEADRNFLEAGTLVSLIGAAYRSARHGGVSCSPMTSEEVTAGA